MAAAIAAAAIGVADCVRPQGQPPVSSSGTDDVGRKGLAEGRQGLLASRDAAHPDIVQAAHQGKSTRHADSSRGVVAKTSTLTFNSLRTWLSNDPFEAAVGVVGSWFSDNLPKGHGAAMQGLIGCGMAVIVIFAVVDFRRSESRKSEGASTSPQAPSVHPAMPKRCERSFMVVVLLTSYRFYTGFLGSTWVPFLIAKEGALLTGAHQSLFMGVQKLIYGFSMLLNPFFGLLSDKLAETPYGCRSIFLLVGVMIAGVGIFLAKVASEQMNVVLYCCASCIWMLGEAMADITTETIAPEMLPASQYDMASSIRSIHHIAGCLLGYLVLILGAAGGIHWHWLYVSYLGLMLLCGLPIVWYIREVSPLGGSGRTRGSSPAWFAGIIEAYVAPTRYEGGFPRACLCMLIYSLGTGPMFFTLLMLRDLVGITDEKRLQVQFSWVSIAFLISATVTAALSGVSGGDPARPEEQVSGAQSSQDAFQVGATDVPPSGATPRPGEGTELSEAERRRWTMMIASTVSFGVACIAIPLACLPGSQTTRLVLFYGGACFLGLTFGAVYTRFQACTWVVLPPNINIANAMGFAGVCKVIGCGMGNFLAGVVLDMFRDGGHAADHHGAVAYNEYGYLTMAWASAGAVFLSAFLIPGIYRRNGTDSSSRRLCWLC